MELRIGPINAATPTPLLNDGGFDHAGTVRLCRRWSDIGLDGVLILGSMGEGILLPEEVRTADPQRPDPDLEPIPGRKVEVRSCPFRCIDRAAYAFVPPAESETARRPVGALHPMRFIPPFGRNAGHESGNHTGVRQR